MLAPERAAPAEDGLTASAVTIQLHGSLRSVLAFLADVPRHEALLEIHDGAFTAATQGEGEERAAIDATVRATLYHLTAQAAKGDF
jgi:hypothetical protein